MARPEIEANNHRFGSTDADVIGWCSLLEPLRCVLKAPKVKVDSVHVASSSGVVVVFPALAHITEGSIMMIRKQSDPICSSAQGRHRPGSKLEVV